ncbi:MAG: SdpI family protein [Lachnospiraceae bacterium]|nr:SdpI family protein [Lachnospiraceae bacterium]
MSMGLDILYFICVLLVPVISIITGYIMKTRPPKEINNTVGYRTKRSMAGKEAWDFANVYCGRNTFLFGIVSLVISAIIYFLLMRGSFSNMTAMIIILVVQITALVIVMAVPTELELKKRFGK